MALTTLTDASTISVDGSQGPAYQVTLGGNHKLGNTSNQVAGQTYTFIVNQDSTGSRTLDYDTNYKFPSGSSSEANPGNTPSLTQRANASDILQFLSDGTYMMLEATYKDQQTQVTPPSSLSASSGLTGVINLSWTNNDSTQDKTYIEYLDATFGWQALDEVTGTGTTYSDSEAAGSYTYRVLAGRNVVVSVPSDSATGDCT